MRREELFMVADAELAKKKSPKKSCSSSANVFSVIHYRRHLLTWSFCIPVLFSPIFFPRLAPNPTPQDRKWSSCPPKGPWKSNVFLSFHRGHQYDRWEWKPNQGLQSASLFLNQQSLTNYIA